MSLFSLLELSGSALSAERRRAEVVTTNMANADTTSTPAGGPFRRKQVVFTSPGGSSFRFHLAGFHRLSQGQPEAVRLSRVVEDSAPPVMRYEPGHPDADKSGFVAYPAINPVVEMVDLMGAMRAYQLNASAISASKQMIVQALDLLK
jgi:flagellar basal-body rod protein FlgC